MIEPAEFAATFTLPTLDESCSFAETVQMRAGVEAGAPAMGTLDGLDHRAGRGRRRGDLRAGDRVIVSEQRGAAGASSAAKSGPPGPRF